MKLPVHLLSDNFVKTNHITEDTPFEIEKIEARSLLCPGRFDLAAKIAYIEARENGADMTFARELYGKHIEAFSEGTFTEPGDKNKTSLDQFFTAFDTLIDDYKAHGFCAEKSLVPVGENNIILDGAHRTACAIYFGGTVTAITFPKLKVNFDYRYFRGRRLSEEMQEYMAVVYSRYAPKPIYLACLWPVASEEKRSEAVRLIEAEHAIVYSTSVSLTKVGLRNFMLQIYQQQDWIGTIENHFAGIMGKVDDCFVPSSPMEAILFEGGELDGVLRMKDRIREIFKLGKHAIHISDSNEETRLMAALLFHENSRHALNYGKPDVYPERFCEMIRYKWTDAKLNRNATLSYYGIEDIGEITPNDSVVDAFNPRTYFVYNGMKIPALTALREGNFQYNSEIERKITKLTKQLTRNNRNRQVEDIRTVWTWRIKKTKLRCMQIAMHITQKVGVYDIIYKIRHR